MSETNDQLALALNQALEELFNADEANIAYTLLESVNKIRDDLNIIMMSDTYAINHIWNDIRSKPGLVQTMMSTTSTFIQCIDKIDQVITSFVPMFVPFTNKSIIVDSETISKAVEHTELKEVLLNNYWLFFLLYAATNKRIVNMFLSSLLPPKSKH